MDAITLLFKQDITSLILGIFIIMSAAIAAVSIIGKFSEIIGKPVKWVRKKNNDHELLADTIKSLSMLQHQHEHDVKESDEHDNEIRKDLKILTDMLLNKIIDDYRWEINNFAIKVSENRKCNKDSYLHCLKTYQKYEKILQENSLENGEVEISMDIIRKSYMEKLKNGF